MPIKVFWVDSMLLSIAKSWNLFQNQKEFDTMAAFLCIKNSGIVSDFCLIGMIPHDFLILKSIESAWKTFIGIQVKVSIE